MNNVTKFTDCYGCGVCAVVCPHKIISIRHNQDGFYTPYIDDLSRCTDCGLCISTCSYNYNDLALPKGAADNIKSYAAWSESSEIRQQCSSGGVGFEIAQYLLSQNYLVCGVRYNTIANIAEHYIADSKEALMQSVGSKYIQSYTVDSLQALDKNKRYVIFGTPCHIDSLRRLIKQRKLEDSYLLVDFFCHGVPSYNMWCKYIQQIKDKIGDYLQVIWRDKKNGWQDSWAIGANRIENSDNISYDYYSLKSKGDIFYKMFLSDCCLGKACYDRCKFKMTASSADIRIGDLWGQKYKSNKEGVSAVLSITSQGEELLQSLENIQLIDEKIDVVTESQMKRSPDRRVYVASIMRELRGDRALETIYNIYVVPYKIVTYPLLFVKKVIRRTKKVLKV